MNPSPPSIFANANMETPARVVLPTGAAVVFTTPSPDRETANEDSAAVAAVGSCSVLIVADGVGGHAAGDRASALAVSSLLDCVAGAPPEGLRAAILDGFESANRAVQALGVGAATTLAVVELRDGNMRPFHAGDSAVLAVGQRGRLKHLTISHSPVGYGVEAGLIQEGDAMHHGERHLVSNLVGTPEMRIEVGPRIKLAPYDTVLLGSDGVFDNLTTDEVVETVRRGRLEQAADSLREQCGKRMRNPVKGAPSKPDDLTFVLHRARG